MQSPTGIISVFALDGQDAPDLPDEGVLIRVGGAGEPRDVVLALDDALELVLELYQAHTRAMAFRGRTRAARLLEREAVAA